MKKILALLFVLLLCVGCSSKKEETVVNNDPSVKEEVSDKDYVSGNGKFIVGITDFAPMDYQENGEWIGFDADLAKAFAEYLNVDVEFLVIDWDNKVMELNNKGIDCVWNGMTITESALNSMEVSNAYCMNGQVVVVKAEMVDSIKSVDDLKGLNFAVEAGSAGAEVVDELGLDYTEVNAQSDALLEVAAGTCDASVIDLLMARAMVGEGTAFANLGYTLQLNSEEYGVGFRKGSDLAEELNKFMQDYYNAGQMEKLAEKYAIQDTLIAQ